MTFSIIQKSQLEGATRLDAEYYQPEYLAIIKKIKTSNFDLISNLLSRAVVTGSTPKERNCKNDSTDIKFIKTDTLREGQIVFDEADCLPLKENIKNSELKAGDIIITIIGATHDIVGRVARVFPSDPKMNINQNVALLRPKEISSSSYISIFLQTKYGRDQIWQQSRQTEQVNLNCREVENVLVALPAQSFIKGIDDLVTSSYELIGESKKIYDQAENLLLEELGLTGFDNDEKLFSTVNLSDAEAVNRIDAEYFQPEYTEVIDKIEKYTGGSDYIKNQFKQNRNLAKRDKEFYNYVEISDVNIISGEIVPTKISSNDVPANGKIKLSKGDLLISKVRPYRGAVSFIDFEMDNLLSSGAFTVLQEKEGYKKEILMVFLKTNPIKKLLLRYNCGTSYPVIKDEDILNLRIPLLSPKIQQKISELVRQSHEARKKSKELLEEAKRKVEDMIEKGN